MLEVDEFTTETVRGWEADIDSGKLASAITQYGLRCKMHAGCVRVWTDNKPDSLPLGIRNRHANAVVQLNGIWHTKKQSGLALQLTDIEFLNEPDPIYPF